VSADNWTHCPRCYKPPETPAARKARLADLYGRVSKAEYDAAVSAPIIMNQPGTLREDYEIGIGTDGGKSEFWVKYRASCDECGFTYAYDHEAEVKP
jgi:hypothetical protein